MESTTKEGKKISRFLFIAYRDTNNKGKFGTGYANRSCSAAR